MSAAIRTFIAIPLATAIQESIKTIQSDLKKLDSHIKWVKPENTHLTLKFLGGVKTKKIAAVKQMLTDSFGTVRSFNIELTKLGSFPSAGHPRILWVGLDNTEGRITQLTSLLEEECARIGFRKETRPFHPHITIGRIHSLRDADTLPDTIARYRLPACPAQKAGTIILYKSTLTPSGPVYEILKEHGLLDT